MVYIERIPAAPLSSCIRMLWYASTSGVDHQRERMLPTGCVQIILNLHRDFLVDCLEDGPDRPMPPSLVIGARSVYEIIDTSDLACLIGVVFEPGGFAPFAGDAVDAFSHRSVSLEDIWGSDARSLRDRLRELPTAHARLNGLENLLLHRLSARVLDPASTRFARHSMVGFALNQFSRRPNLTTVRDVARATGFSERRFSQVFREQVGLSPKIWCRVQRFQRAVRSLHRGHDIPWAQLALDCGFYDQSHFSNEFRAFSGIDPTTYTQRRTLWANHVDAK